MSLGILVGVVIGHPFMGAILNQDPARHTPQNLVNAVLGASQVVSPLCGGGFLFLQLGIASKPECKGLSNYKYYPPENACCVNRTRYTPQYPIPVFKPFGFRV